MITCQTRAYHLNWDCLKNQSNSAGARPPPPTGLSMPGGYCSQVLSIVNAPYVHSGVHPPVVLMLIARVPDAD